MVAYFVPISVKGIVFDNGKVWLRKNERYEWELPGGKLECGEQPEQTVKRELLEELGFTVNVITIVHSYLCTIKPSNNSVFVVTYLCRLIDKTGKIETVGEAGPAAFNSFSVKEISKLHMPDFYKAAIEKAATLDQGDNGKGA